MIDKYDWYEELPDMCPPSDAMPPQNRTFYRVAKGNPAEDSDFYSHKMLYIEKHYTNECIARAVSIFEDIDDTIRLTKLPSFRGGKCIAKIVLNESDGVIKKTSKGSHYSWWRTKTFNFAASSIV